MNDAHLHLILNHLPIILPLVGLFIMIGGLILKVEVVKRTAYLVFIVSALAAIAAMSTGEGAEEVIEELNGIDENFIKTHEEVAETFALLCYVLGGISVVGLWANFYKKSFANVLTYFTILVCSITLYFAKQTGTSGGEIRHIEIRPSATTKNS